MKSLLQSYHKIVLAFLAVLALSLNACDQLNLDDCFEPLNGTWARINSTNPANDCMKIVISGDVAVLFANPKNVSWVDEGDNLWRNITHVKQFQEYSMEVLGSDGNFYAASLKLDGTNTLLVSIDASGSGSEQEWVRVGASEVLPECETTSLNGSWTRTLSNNPSLDGMKVRVLDEQASITFLPASATNFAPGDIVWKDIQSTSGEQFGFEVLGSDGNYYNATITVLDKNKLEISIPVSGAGSEQIWER